MTQELWRSGEVKEKRRQIRHLIDLLSRDYNYNMLDKEKEEKGKSSEQATEQKAGKIVITRNQGDSKFGGVNRKDSNGVIEIE